MFSKDCEVLHLEREESSPAGFLRKVPENLIAVGLDAGDVGRDGVDHHVGLLRHFESLIAGVAALVIVAIADDYDGAAELVPRLVLRELVAAGEVDAS